MKLRSTYVQTDLASPNLNARIWLKAGIFLGLIALNSAFLSGPARPVFGSPYQIVQPVAQDLQRSERLTTLEQFEAAAIQNNPTLNIAVALVQAARHQATQAGLKPNPTFGIWSEEIGNADSALLGAYIRQVRQRGGKRCLNQKVKEYESRVLEREYEQQKLRILTDVRTAFFNLLIAQRQTQLTKQLNEAQTTAAQQIKKLYESEESPKTDLFQAEIKARQTANRARQTELARISAWRELTAIIGMPDLPITNVVGSLDELPEIVEWERVLNHLLTNSPEIHTAEAKIEQANATYQQALAYSVPDIETQFSVGQDTFTDDTFGGFQIGIPIQRYNRNQGNIAAARASKFQAQQDLRRVQLSIQKRLASIYGDYQAACEQTKAYTDEMLPKAKETLDLVTEGYREGEVSFLQLLAAQQTTIDLTTQYLQILKTRWISQQKIEGMLLDNSLDQ